MQSEHSEKIVDGQEATQATDTNKLEALCVSTESYQALQDDNDRLTKANEELTKRMQYMTADAQNTARRHQEECRRIRQYTSSSTVEALFPLIDSLEAASQVDDNQQNTSRESGMHNTLQLMYSIFEKLGVLTINPEIDSVFDPTLHSAVATEAASVSDQANTIVNVLRKGYQLHDRVLRPAMVVIRTTE